MCPLVNGLWRGHQPSRLATPSALLIVLHQPFCASPYALFDAMLAHLHRIMLVLQQQQHVLGQLGCGQCQLFEELKRRKVADLFERPAAYG